jgi:hypothetical protein
MTPIELVDKLVEFIKPVVTEFELDSNVHGVKKSPQVIAGYLKEKKPKQHQNPPDIPFVIVRYLEDTDKDDGDMATVKVIAGTYSEDEQDGWRDAMNVITRIKKALLEQRLIGGPFRVEYPIKTELPEEQPYPEWAAFLIVNVSIPHILEEGGYLQDVYE